VAIKPAVLFRICGHVSPVVLSFAAFLKKSDVRKKYLLIAF
jgi:hypothetical protein